MAWTTPEDIRAAVEKLWETGKLPASIISDVSLFPLAIVIKGPSSREMTENIVKIQRWNERLSAFFKERRVACSRLEYRRINHRILGENSIPIKAIIENQEEALALARKTKEAALLATLAEETACRLPALLSFIYSHPHKVLAKAVEWPALLAVCEWMLAHPRPGVYLREMNAPGVHTKFIEANKALLSKLLDLLLPENAVDRNFTADAFERRYGFRVKPEIVRIRLPFDCAEFPWQISDLSLTEEEFAALDINCTHIVITENQINFLTIPRARCRLIIWGRGYGFEIFKKMPRLADKEIFYWGDIDTHGFAILSELRAIFPRVRSFLMDEATLLAHLTLCVEEPKPSRNIPQNLTEEERLLCEKLQRDLYGCRLRLEQERISIESVRDAIKQFETYSSSAS